MNCARSAGYLLFVGALAVLPSCDGGDETTSSGGGVTAIANSDDAEFFLQSMIEGVVQRNVLLNLDTETPNGTVVSGSLGGSATVSGTARYISGQSCGMDCVESHHETELTIVFDDFSVMSNDNTQARVSGEISYTDDTWSRQSGMNYSSGGWVGGSGSNVHGRFVVDGDWGLDDVVSFTFSAYKGDLYSMTGDVSCSNGTYYF